MSQHNFYVKQLDGTIPFPGPGTFPSFGLAEDALYKLANERAGKDGDFYTEVEKMEVAPINQDILRAITSRY